MNHTRWIDAYNKFMHYRSPLQHDIQGLDEVLLRAMNCFCFTVPSSLLFANGQLERTDSAMSFFDSKDNLKLSFPPILTNEAVLSASEKQIAAKVKQLSSPVLPA